MIQSSTSQFKNSSRRAFTILLQNCNELVICLDLDLCIIEFNNAAAKAHNWKRNEVIHKNYMKLCLKSNFTNPISFDPAKILAGKRITHHESTFINSNSEQTHCTISWTITRLLNDNKEPYGILMIGMDITDIKEAWAQVYNLDSIIKHAPGLIYYWKDKDSIHLGCNNSFAELAGLKSREEVIGKTDCDLPWKKQAESYRKDDQEVIASGKPKNNIQETLVAADGKLRIMVANKVPLRNIEGNIIGVLATAADITQLKDAEQAILEAKHRAELANQTKSNFLAIMSHELRTPLNAIMGMTQILQNKNPTEEQQECINIIRNSSTSLLTLINDILDFAQLETGNLEIIHEDFNLYELINKIVAELQPQLDNNKQIKLLLHYSDTTPHHIILDACRIRQILFNLINNAIKFTKKGEINVSITSKQQANHTITLHIAIMDTGIGIPANRLEQIFERFTQVESQYSRRFDGAGLGLAISKQLVEAMGGTIGVSSTLGKGSNFWIEFTTKIPHSLPNSEPSSDLIIHNPRVLLVEDNLLNQKVAKSILEELGCCLDIAGTGKEALQLFNKTDYHLIFMDISLPDTDGLTITQSIRKHKSKKASTPIVALTAHALREDRDNCFKAGIDDMITKPIMQDKLKIVLQQWAGKKSKQPHKLLIT